MTASSREYTPAGVVSRVVAALVDAVVVAVTAGGMFLTVAAAEFIWRPKSFSWPKPAPWLSLAVLFVLATVYLAAGWATNGRTIGGSLMGLRVLSAARRPVGWSRATGRAVLCVLFPIGLLWVAVSGSRRSVQDLLMRSLVVHDWHHALDAAARPVAVSPGAGEVGPHRRPPRSVQLGHGFRQ
ncbi:MAG: RDD family protein [Labedaea sp.]